MRIDPDGERAMVRQARRRGHRRPWRPLLSALLALAGGEGELLRHDEHPWASITFSGSHHTITLRFAGLRAIAASENLIAALPEHEFTLPRHVVIDAAVVSAAHETLPEPRLTVTVELLLLEDA
jgi:hypothetical protein